jgi:predicted membrane chloride channel (bestrophin family)
MACGTAAALCLAWAWCSPPHAADVVQCELPDLSQWSCLPALMISCRTNSSYDRWKEALASWGDIGNRCRDTMRQVSVMHIFCAFMQL